jgi:NADH:ubiquinone oxidoreductase subunit 2 (subunit N)
MTLSLPLLWVILPLIIALVTVAFYNRKMFGVIFTTASAFILALLALVFPEDMILSLGPLELIFEESLGFLGRQITLAYEILRFIALLYFANGLWALASGLKGVPATFRPVSLVITALLTAALGVEPFLYAALLIEAAVLVSIPMLSPMGKPPKPGILRYLTLQSLAMPFILTAGWLLTGVESLPPDSPLVVQSVIALGLGIALWLAVFPFHSWVPVVSQHSNALVMTFLQFILPTVVVLFSLNFINRYTFLRESPALFLALQTVGTIMIVIGGAWTAFQHDLKRAFGFSTLTETGFALLAVGLIDQGGLDWMVLLLPARAFGYWLWGYTLTLLEAHTGAVEMKQIKGFARHHPILSIGLLLAQLSIAGLPILAAFPFKIALLTAAVRANTALGIWAFLGNLGLFFFTVRLLVYLATPEDIEAPNRWRLEETKYEMIPVLLMIGVLIVLGLFPQPFLSNILQTLTAFSQLQ